MMVSIKRKTFVLTILVIWTFHCFGQNKTSKKGLKLGKWTEESEMYFGKIIEIGFYKIIPLSTYKTIRPLGETTFKIKYKGSTPLLFFSGRHHNNISVKDSIWQTFDSNGKIYKTDYWVQGLNIWTKYFDNNGNLIQHDYDDLENDTSFYLTYKNNQLYKKAFYPPENKDQETEIFYPNNNLRIPNAEPVFYAKFGDTSVNSIQLKLSCKNDLTIISVSSSSKNIKVSFPYKSIPYKLTTKDTATFNLIFAATPSSFRNNDTITIITFEENVQAYKIYCTLRASHIDGRNIKTLKEISLSKTNDRYLLISPMGTATDAFIKTSSGILKRYKIDGITKIDLSELNIGEYELAIYSCHTGGNIKLKISE